MFDSHCLSRASEGGLVPKRAWLESERADVAGQGPNPPAAPQEGDPRDAFLLPRPSPVGMSCREHCVLSAPPSSCGLLGLVPSDHSLEKSLCLRGIISNSVPGARPGHVLTCITTSKEDCEMIPECVTFILF